MKGGNKSNPIMFPILSHQNFNQEILFMEISWADPVGRGRRRCVVNNRVGSEALLASRNSKKSEIHVPESTMEVYVNHDGDSKEIIGRRNNCI